MGSNILGLVLIGGESATGSLVGAELIVGAGTMRPSRRRWRLRGKRGSCMGIGGRRRRGGVGSAVKSRCDFELGFAVKARRDARTWDATRLFTLRFPPSPSSLHMQTVDVSTRQENSSSSESAPLKLKASFDQLAKAATQYGGDPSKLLAELKKAFSLLTTHSVRPTLSPHSPTNLPAPTVLPFLAPEARPARSPLRVNPPLSPRRASQRRSCVPRCAGGASPEAGDQALERGEGEREREGGARGGVGGGVGERVARDEGLFSSR